MVGRTLVVCEVKSTRVSETHQIRLGLGQVLHYRAMLTAAAPGSDVVPALLVEGPPADPLWTEVCRSVGVLLFWPDRWDDIAREIAEASSG
jgi:hypothetical protein